MDIKGPKVTAATPRPFPSQFDSHSPAFDTQDKQKESLIHEDNSRVTDLKCASDQNQNQFYSGKQSLVHTELQTVSTFLKELLARQTPVS
ncbi:hypothetical protein TURU_100779 [Turdus rufiventris]|nr:hypothetical protein TURU_100779 [Turdus rufiventris]